MKLAADANVLLSAVTGGRASLVLSHPKVEEVVTAAVTLAEVHQYAEHLARKKRLPLDLLMLALATLPVTIVERELYSDKIPEASRRIGARDPDDIEIFSPWHSILTCPSGRTTTTSRWRE